MISSVTSPLRIGERLAGYRIVSELGRGGMAHVYLAVTHGLSDFQKLCVLKVLRPQFAEDEQLVAMFHDEARIAARLNHHNVVQTFDAGRDGERHFIAMEYLEGRALSHVMARVGTRHDLPLALRLSVLLDVLAALEYLHELSNFDGAPLNLVHRDVSPQNVFVTFAGRAKLLDFGIAKSEVSTSHTEIGTCKGKVTYMAPEQIRGDKVDLRADIFAAGVVLWELVAGQRMWPRGVVATDVMRRVTLGLTPSLRDVFPGAPPHLVDVCARAMSLHPRDRFASAHEMAAAIRTELTRSDEQRAHLEIASNMAALFADVIAMEKRLLAQSAPWLRQGDGTPESRPPMSSGVNMNAYRTLPSITTAPLAATPPDDPHARAPGAAAPAASAVSRRWASVAGGWAVGVVMVALPVALSAGFGGGRTLGSAGAPAVPASTAPRGAFTTEIAPAAERNIQVPRDAGAPDAAAADDAAAEHDLEMPEF